MNLWLEQIKDALRKLYFHPVIYCLYEKTRKRKLTWLDGVARDGGITFKFDWSWGDQTLEGYDDITNQRVIRYHHRGVDSLYSLMRDIAMEPEELAKAARIKKYLRENC